MDHPVIRSAEAATGVRLSASGNVALLNLPRRCLLVSRAEKAPQPSTAWLRDSLQAVKFVVAKDEVLVSGVGRTAWEAALFSCARMSGRAILICDERPADPTPHFWPRDTLLLWPETPLIPAERDRLIAAFADRAYAIHIRKNGNMASLAELLRARGCPVEVFHPSSPALIENSIPPESADPLPPAGVWNYLTHYTRQPDGPFPGESYSDYLRWLCGGTESTPRDAFASLCRILAEKRIRACGRLMPTAAPAVCLTALLPSEAIPLRAWRRGLRRWSFTRYGLAIQTDVLRALNATRVEYVSSATLKAAAPDRAPFMQLQRSGNDNWSAEAEWRIAGDLSLDTIEARHMLALVTNSSEKSHIQKLFSIHAAIID